MSTRLLVAAAFCAGLLTMVVVDRELITPVQGQEVPGAGFAAVPGQKGGQDIFGPYEAVPNWPRPMSESLPGHENWTYSVTMDVFAESPNRVIVASKGELPLIAKRPEQSPA